jgi:hypothetical protein
MKTRNKVTIAPPYHQETLHDRKANYNFRSSHSLKHRYHRYLSLYMPHHVEMIAKPARRRDKTSHASLEGWTILRPWNEGTWRAIEQRLGGEGGLPAWFLTTFCSEIWGRPVRAEAAGCRRGLSLLEVGGCQLSLVTLVAGRWSLDRCFTLNIISIFNKYHPFLWYDYHLSVEVILHFRLATKHSTQHSASLSTLSFSFQYQSNQIKPHSIA